MVTPLAGHKACCDLEIFCNCQTLKDEKFGKTKNEKYAI